VIVTKKLKSADGTATPAAKQGVADDVIRADDTIIVPITQFSSPRSFTTRPLRSHLLRWFPLKATTQNFTPTTTATTTQST
jgi:hypothetical protein